MAPEDPSPKGPSFREALSEKVSGGEVLRDLVGLAGLWLAIDAQSAALKVLGGLLLVLMAYPGLKETVRTVREWDRESDRRRKASKPPEDR